MRSASPSFLSQLPSTSMLCLPVITTDAYGPPWHDSMRLAGQQLGLLHGREDDCLADLAALGNADVGRDLRPHERGCVQACGRATMGVRPLVHEAAPRRTRRGCLLLMYSSVCVYVYLFIVSACGCVPVYCCVCLVMSLRFM